MNFLNKLFGEKEEPINSYDDFWKWFQKNEKAFLKAINDQDNIEETFFNKISPKLSQLREGFFFLAGMEKDGTAELVLTADGNVTNIVFVEELVEAAPKISGWKFTALKEEHDIENANIGMAGYEFIAEKLWFYPTEHDEFPDQIDLNIVHSDFNEENEQEISAGTYIFLDIFLGELRFATTIDGIDFITKEKAEKELIPIEKLKDFLKWREKEFIEKYEGTRYDTENDMHTNFSGEYENGDPIYALINTELLRWESKASHPWILKVEIEYEGNEFQLPNENTMDLLDQIEEDIEEELKDFEGYLNIGRRTTRGVREIYFACKEFRKPPKIIDKIKSKYADSFEISFDINKDKYWYRFNRFLSPQ